MLDNNNSTKTSTKIQNEMKQYKNQTITKKTTSEIKAKQNGANHITVLTDMIHAMTIVVFFVSSNATLLFTYIPETITLAIMICFF